jgi:hypothetical protein
MMRAPHERLAISEGVKRYWQKPESARHREMLRDHPPKLGYTGGRIPHLPAMTDDQRKLYRKMIRAGIDRAEALAEAMKMPANPVFPVTG